jgi:arabinan endo-1,5-alpha-L-arabinosidase
VQLGRDISAVVPFSIPLSLHEDGTVSGVWQGTWTFGSGASILLTDAQGRVSKGVASIQWSEWHDAFTVVFSAMSSDGLTLWGVRDRER